MRSKHRLSGYRVRKISPFHVPFLLPYAGLPRVSCFRRETAAAFPSAQAMSVRTQLIDEDMHL